MYENRAILQWLNGEINFPTLHLDNLNLNPGNELEIKLVIHTVKHLHEALGIEFISLARANQQFNSFKRRAIEELGELYHFPIREGEDIESAKGYLFDFVPECSSPIYIITIAEGREGEEEEIVYIGQTTGKSHRFKNGHKVALKLLEPRYNSFVKKIYICSPFVVKEMGPQCAYLSVDSIQSLEIAQRVINSIETSLIRDVQPKFNDINGSAQTFPINLDMENGLPGREDVRFRNLDVY
jgi:hypothetical protein